MGEGDKILVEATIERLMDFGRQYLVKLPGGARVVVDALGARAAE